MREGPGCDFIVLAWRECVCVCLFFPRDSFDKNCVRLCELCAMQGLPLVLREEGRRARGDGIVMMKYRRRDKGG